MCMLPVDEEIIGLVILLLEHVLQTNMDLGEKAVGWQEKPKFGSVRYTEKNPWTEAFTWLREILIIQPVLNGLVAESSSWCCFVWSTDVADTTSEPEGQTSWSQSAAKGGRQQKGSFAWHCKGHTCQSPSLSSATSTAFSATSSHKVVTEHTHS